MMYDIKRMSTSLPLKILANKSELRENITGWGGVEVFLVILLVMFCANIDEMFRARRIR
jgi:hypothetical protein